ncbi:MAG TPA: polyprenyl diphosphate synthase [Candidatus Saccharimonadales bacterium]|nr:polyprenyl diphosphate synthase [Candidatus Saccharimonadales bacterium]
MTQLTAAPIVPQHIGLILDGNRRWARAHGLSVAEGYHQGYLNLRNIADECEARGVKYLSAYAFSTENWKRDRTEIADLMKLLKWVLKHELQEFQRRGIRLRVLGSRLKFGKALVSAIHNAEKLTENNDRCTLLMCLDYGGQQEIVDAMKRIMAKGISASKITPELINQHLYAPDVPPIDLIIRTSGEQRLSNFMLWESAYSEFVFDKVEWPDFSVRHLDAALKEYARRQRRFGS